jgi:hypothetical protein
MKGNDRKVHGFRYLWIGMDSNTQRRKYLIGLLIRFSSKRFDKLYCEFCLRSPPAEADHDRRVIDDVSGKLNVCKIESGLNEVCSYHTHSLSCVIQVPHVLSSLFWSSQQYLLKGACYESPCYLISLALLFYRSNSIPSDHLKCVCSSLKAKPQVSHCTKLQIKLNIFTLVIVQIAIFLGRDAVYSYSFITTLRMNVLLRNVCIRPQDHTVSEPRNPQFQGNVM